MSIDFPCTNCQRTIRVPDGSEGKKTKCPQCEEVQRIPGERRDVSDAGALSGGATGGNGGDPAWEAPMSSSSQPSTAASNQGNYGQPSNPFGDADISNPYASPPATAVSAGLASREAAKATLMGPAIATIIVAVMAWLGHSGLFLAQLFAQEMMDQPAMQDPQAKMILYTTFIGIPVIMTLAAMVIVAAMSRALQVRNYGFVLTGFILAMIPCTTGYCCVLALPFSVWGIVVMLDDSVKAAFRLP